MSNRFLDVLAQGGPVVADGGMGTMLMAAGLLFGDPPEQWNVLPEKRALVGAVHRSYLDAGAQIVLTNSFGGSPFRLKLHNLQGQVFELNRAAAALARAETGDLAVVAGSIGPSGELFEPLGPLTSTAAVEGFAAQAEGLAAGGADVFWVETMSDLNEVLTNAMRKNAESYFASDVIDRPIIDSANAGEPMKLLNANSYPKGAWVLHMLRGQIGDSAFFGGLRAYYRTYRDSNATSEDFQRVMERSARSDLGWFFHQWLYQPGYPQLDVSWRYDARARRVVLGITQRQKPEWGVFRLPHLTIEFHGAGGTVGRRDIAVAGRQTDVRLDVPFAPTEIRVDPAGNLLLKTAAPPSVGGKR